VRKLVILLVVLSVLGAVDAAAKAMAENQIERRARLEAGSSASASADIDSVPFLGKLLATGNAGDLTVRLKEVAGQQLTFSTVSLKLQEIHLDKGKLFSGKVEITSIRRGTITVGLDADALERIIRMPVKLEDGEVRVTVGGQPVTVSPSVTAEGSVRLSASGFPGFTGVNVPFPQTRIVSCPVARVVVADGELRASCDIDKIPPALLRAASRVAN
jgi:hypothetical protein